MIFLLWKWSIIVNKLYLGLDYFLLYYIFYNIGQIIYFLIYEI